MSNWKECRNYENCGCYCIYPDEVEAGLCGNRLEEHNEDERAAELERLRAELAHYKEAATKLSAETYDLEAELTASREREARMRELFKRYEAEMRADNLIAGMAAYEDFRDYMLAEGAQG